MTNQFQFPEKFLFSLERVPDEVLILEDSLNINLYNSQLLHELIMLLDDKNTALQKLSHYCQYLVDFNGSREYNAMVEVIRSLGMYMYNTLLIHQLYSQNNQLLYDLLGVSDRRVYLKRKDYHNDNEMLQLKIDEFRKGLMNDRYNVGLYRFISEHGSK